MGCGTLKVSIKKNGDWDTRNKIRGSAATRSDIAGSYQNTGCFHIMTMPSVLRIVCRANLTRVMPHSRCANFSAQYAPHLLLKLCMAFAYALDGVHRPLWSFTLHTYLNSSRRDDEYRQSARNGENCVEGVAKKVQLCKLTFWPFLSQFQYLGGCNNDGRGHHNVVCRFTGRLIGGFSRYIGVSTSYIFPNCFL